MLCGIELRYSTLLAHVHLGWNMEEGIDWHIRLVQKEVSTIGVCFSALDFSGEMDFFFIQACLSRLQVCCMLSAPDTLKPLSSSSAQDLSPTSMTEYRPLPLYIAKVFPPRQAFERRPEYCSLQRRDSARNTYMRAIHGNGLVDSLHTLYGQTLEGSFGFGSQVMGREFLVECIEHVE